VHSSRRQEREVGGETSGNGKGVRLKSSSPLRLKHPAWEANKGPQNRLLGSECGGLPHKESNKVREKATSDYQENDQDKESLPKQERGRG